MAGGRSISVEHSGLKGSSAQRLHVQWQRAGSRLQRMLHARCNHLSALPAALSSAWHCCPSRLTLRYCGLQVTHLIDLIAMNHAR